MFVAFYYDVPEGPAQPAPDVGHSALRRPMRVDVPLAGYAGTKANTGEQIFIVWSRKLLAVYDVNHTSFAWVDGWIYMLHMFIYMMPAYHCGYCIGTLKCSQVSATHLMISHP